MLENSIVQGTLVETLTVTSLAYPIQEFVKCLPTCMEACVATLASKNEKAPPVHAIDRMSPILTTIVRCCPDVVPHLTTIKTSNWIMTMIEHALTSRRYLAVVSILKALLSCGPDLQAHFSSHETRDWLMKNDRGC